MIEKTYVGKLDDVSVLEILENLYQNKASGILDLQKEREQRRFFILSGDVCGAMSNSVAHKIGQYLLSKGIINNNQLQIALKDITHGTRLGQKLINLGFVDKNTFEKALGELMENIVFESLGWFTGLYRFTTKESPIPQDIIFRIPMPLIFFKGAFSYISSQFAQMRLPYHAILKPSPNISQLIQNLNLTPEQVFILGKCDGRNKVEEILNFASGKEEEILKFLYACKVSGLVLSSEEEKAEPLESFLGKYQDRATGTIPTGAPKKKRRKIKWLKPKLPEAKLSSEDVQKIREKIRKTYNNLSRMSYYELLECPMKATQKEIHYAFLALCQFYHPEIAEKEPAFSDLKPLMEAIYDKMEEAYLVLVDVKTRADYDRRLYRSEY
jgi:hypothetical protein